MLLFFWNKVSFNDQPCPSQRITHRPDNDDVLLWTMFCSIKFVYNSRSVGKMEIINFLNLGGLLIIPSRTTNWIHSMMLVGHTRSRNRMDSLDKIHWTSTNSNLISWRYEINVRIRSWYPLLRRWWSLWLMVIDRTELVKTICEMTKDFSELIVEYLLKFQSWSPPITAWSSWTSPMEFQSIRQRLQRMSKLVKYNIYDVCLLIRYRVRRNGG